MVPSVRLLLPWMQAFSSITVNSLDRDQKITVRTLVDDIVKNISEKYSTQLSQAPSINVTAFHNFVTTQLQVLQVEILPDGPEKTFLVIASIQTQFRAIMKQNELSIFENRELLDLLIQCEQIRKKLITCDTSTAPSYWNEIGYCQPFFNAYNLKKLPKSVQTEVLKMAQETIKETCIYGEEVDFPEDPIQKGFIKKCVRDFKKRY